MHMNMMSYDQSEAFPIDTITEIFKSLLYWRYYVEACNVSRDPSPRLSVWTTQLRRNVAAMASRWRHCDDLNGPRIEAQTSRTDNDVFNN